MANTGPCGSKVQARSMHSGFSLNSLCLALGQAQRAIGDEG